MRLTLPEKSLLKKTGEVDYFDWNYKFPIKHIQKYRFRRIIQMLGNQNFDTLLEAGTGSGIFLPELSKHCSHLYAIDIHHDFDNIENLCKKSGISDFHLSTQSIDQTNFNDESFDAIVAVSVLEFVPDIPKALGEIKRILKKDGIFVTICPMESNFLDFFLSLYTRKKPGEEFGSSRQKVTTFIESNFTILKKGYLLGKYFPVYTHYKLKKP